MLSMRHLRCCPDAFNREFMVIDRIFSAVGRIFNRAADQPGGGGKPDGFRNCVGIVSKAILKIGAHGEINSRNDFGHVRDHLVTADREILLPDRKRVSSARGCERLKANMCQ